MNRGQTTLDFAIGASVFLIVVAFTLAFIPGMFEPFNETQESKSVAADRVASALAEGLLADPSNPYELEKGCVISFFALENSDGDPSDDEDAYPNNDGTVRGVKYDITNSNAWSADTCNFAIDESIHERIGIDERTKNLQIKISGDVDGDGASQMLCIDSNEDTNTDPEPETEAPIIEAADPYGGACDIGGGDYDVAFMTDTEPPTDVGSVVVARRIAQLEGNVVTIEVKVW